MPLTLILAALLLTQQSAPAPNTVTVEHTFTSPTAPFTLTLPAQWETELQPNTSEVNFHRGPVSVLVSADKMPADDPVSSFLKVIDYELKQACPTAELIDQGPQVVAGNPGRYFRMRCQGPPGQPTDVWTAATYVNGRLYSFATTVFTKYVADLKPVFDQMLASFQVIPDRSLETPAQKKTRYAAAEAAFDRGHAEVKKLCASGTLSTAECTGRVARLQADRGAAEEGSTATSGQVISF